VSAGAVKSFLSRHGLAASRELGQNFLVDDTLATRLVELSGVESDDSVIEVGTGLGALTEALAARAQRVVSIEIDAGIVRALRAEGRLPANVELVHGDALEIDLAGWVARCGGRVRVVANLPYQVSAPLLRRFLELRSIIADWSVMLQSEVAARLLAAPGSRDYGSFSVLHRLTVSFSRQMDLSPNCFFPVPRVHTSFVRITPLKESAVGGEELEAVERVVRAAFAKRRKTVLNSLRSGGLCTAHSLADIQTALARADIDPRARAESLEPEALLALARQLGRTP
jgi:16S rRNA (adenine1518-N6/adenine1519-N6)-dimethyltransferase